MFMIYAQALSEKRKTKPLLLYEEFSAVDYPIVYNVTALGPMDLSSRII